MESQYAPLSEACAKTLCEKMYDKRKIAAAEIEKYANIHNIAEYICPFSNALYYSILEWSRSSTMLKTMAKSVR